MAKAVVMYSSETGNTEKVARGFVKSLLRYGWQVDNFKIGQNWKREPVTLNRYDLLCVGSQVHWSLPSPWLVELLRSPEIPSGRISPGPQCGVAFSTYGGAHLGPREADTCLTYLEVLFEHLGFKAIGRLAIPGKVGKALNPQFYHPDLHNRPDKNDMGRISSFVEELHRRSELISLIGEKQVVDRKTINRRKK